MHAPLALLLTASMAAAQSTQSFDAIARQADAARAHDKLAEAAQLYQRALRMRPGWADGWWSLGTILYDTDRHAECADAFTRFTAIKPDVGPAHALLGLCEFGRKHYDAALRHLFRAQELGFAGDDQIRRVAVYHTALALILNGEFERAVEQLAVVAAIAPAQGPVRTAAGLAALRMRLLPEQVPPAEHDLVERMGNAMTAELERRQEDALRLFEATLAVYPQAPNVHYAYGSLLLDSDPAKGLAELKQELAISPRHVPAMAAIAYEYLKEADAQSALPYAEKAAQIAPGDFAARTAYGRALLETDRIPEAVAELETAVRLAPESPHARFALASAYARAGREADAERERKEFARLRKLVDSGRK